MEKEENPKQQSTDDLSEEKKEEVSMSESESTEKDEVFPEEKIKELEDKLTRTFAEMENQRRRFEKEKEEAFEYGGYAFAKEALNLIDNLERSKQVLENDEILKNTDSLKKTLDHLAIINKDLMSIFTKNNVPQEC